MSAVAGKDSKKDSTPKAGMQGAIKWMEGYHAGNSYLIYIV